MEIKESYDNWEFDHPFISGSYTNFKKFQEWFKDNHQKINQLFHGLTEKERKVLEYILYSLDDKQEYDAGNSILIASQRKWLSDYSLSLIADILLKPEYKFNSKIGKILLVKIGRSIGVQLYCHDNGAAGKKIFQLAIETTNLLTYGKDNIIKEWEKFKNQHPNLYNELYP